MFASINRDALQAGLVDACGCSIQHDGWPCPTCFYDLGFEQPDWHALCAFRGDYAECYDVGTGSWRLASGIVFKDDGVGGQKFSHHTFTTYTTEELETRVQAMLAKVTT